MPWAKAGWRKDRRTGRRIPEVRWQTFAGEERRRTCPTAKIAQQLETDIRAAHALGRDWVPEGEQTPLTLETVFEAALGAAARHLRPASVQQREVSCNHFLRFACDEAGTMAPRVDFLSRAALGRFYDWMRTVRGNTPLSAVQRTRLLFYVWQWAFEESLDFPEWQGRIPVPRLPELPEAQPEIRQDLAPTLAQVDKAIAGAESRRVTHWYAKLLTVARFTGLRKSQIMGLLWSDIDMGAHTLVVRPELGKSKQERQGRVVPLAPEFVKLLGGWGLREGFLVRTLAEERANPKLPPPARRIDGKALTSIWEDSGAPEQDYRQPMHGIRKALVRFLASKGVREEVRKALVGHTRGTHGEVYTGAIAPGCALWSDLVAAVALIPPLDHSAVAPEVDEITRRRTGTGPATAPAQARKAKE